MADHKTFNDAIRIALREESMEETETVCAEETQTNGQVKEIIRLLTKILNEKGPINVSRMTQEILLCGPASIIDGFNHDVPTKILVDMGASMSIVNQRIQQTQFPHVVLHPGIVNATAVMGDPVKFKLCSPNRYSLREFTVMPFGLCRAPATFQRLMEIMLAGLNWELCLFYLDNRFIGIIYESKNDANGMQKILNNLQGYVPKFEDNGTIQYSQQGIVGDQLTFGEGVKGLFEFKMGTMPQKDARVVSAAMLELGITDSDELPGLDGLPGNINTFSKQQ
eukprot:gene7296-12996_t